MPTQFFPAVLVPCPAPTRDSADAELLWGIPAGAPPQQPAQHPRPSGSFANGPAMASSGSRIDPAQIPRPRAGVAADPGEDADGAEPMIFETRLAGKHALPPPTSSRYMCVIIIIPFLTFSRHASEHLPCSSNTCMQLWTQSTVCCQMLRCHAACETEETHRRGTCG